MVKTTYLLANAVHPSGKGPRTSSSNSVHELELYSLNMGFLFGAPRRVNQFSLAA